MSFATFTTPDGKAVSIHHSAVVVIEEAEPGQVNIHFRVGDTLRTLSAASTVKKVEAAIKKSRQADFKEFEAGLG